MADETTTQTAATPIVDKAKKISLATFGGGRKPSDDEQKRGGCMIGEIYGKADGVRSVESLDPKTGELTTYQSITGQFRAHFPDGREIGAGTLYLPGGFHEDMVKALGHFDETSGAFKANGNEVDFHFEVRCVQASNKAGYSYVITPLVQDMKQGDADVFGPIMQRAALAKAERQKQLAGPAAKGAHK